MDLKKDDIENLWNEFNIMKEFCSNTVNTVNTGNSSNNKNENNFIIKKCKVCNCNITMSYKYEGKFPLCYKHRDPNNR